MVLSHVLLLVACAFSTCLASWNTVFSVVELGQCQRLRSPNLFASGSASKPVLHLVARCCGANMCSGKSDAAGTNVGDDNADAVVVMKTSSDIGQTWGGFQQLTPNPAGGKGYGMGFGLYTNNGAIVQYVNVGNTAPAINIQYFQIRSTDMVHWSTPQDMTAQLAHCSPLGSGNMMTPSDGSKCVSDTGRLINPMHDHGGNGMVAFSDDNGNSWNCSNHFSANEISAARNPKKGGPDDLYMNGRGAEFSFAPQRAEYFSNNNGGSWAGPTPSKLTGDDGCERSLRADPSGVLYSCEPTGKKRTDMQCECSLDGGATWPHYNIINDAQENDHAGYNDIWIVGDQIVIVMEDNKNNNMYSHSFSTSWCKS